MEEQRTVTFWSITCITCGIVFMVTREYYETLKEKHLTFYCPNGHSLVFRVDRPSKCQREIEELKTEKSKVENFNRTLLEDRERLRRELRDLKKEQCPYCDKRLLNVKLHIRKQHPEKYETN